MRNDVDYIEEFKVRAETAVNSINELSKNFTIKINYTIPNESRNKDYEDLNHFVYTYLREQYKDNPYVLFD